MFTIRSTPLTPPSGVSAVQLSDGQGGGRDLRLHGSRPRPLPRAAGPQTTAGQAGHHAAPQQLPEVSAFFEP